MSAATVNHRLLMWCRRSGSKRSQAFSITESTNLRNDGWSELQKSILNRRKGQTKTLFKQSVISFVPAVLQRKRGFRSSMRGLCKQDLSQRRNSLEEPRRLIFLVYNMLIATIPPVH